MTDTQHCILKIFPPKSCLPSFDPDCLAVLAYSKFGAAPLEIKHEGFDRLGFLGYDPVPCLSVGERSKHATAVESVMDSLREMKYGTDFELSQKECSDAVAFIELMNSRLRPAVIHTYWLEEGNFDNLTREMYATALPMPSAIFYPRILRQKANEHVYIAEGSSMDYMSNEEIEKAIYRDAVCCLNYLSDKLGTKPFLFGNTPTTVDAIMFGYLAPILRLNFPKSRLKGHIESYQNLVQTTDYILRRYFPPTSKDLETQKKEKLVARGLDDEDKEFPNKGRDTFIAVVFGLTVVFSYAILRAGISVVIEDDVE